MRGQGLITRYADYWDLPEPVVTAYRLDARERHAAQQREIDRVKRQQAGQR